MSVLLLPEVSGLVSSQNARTPDDLFIALDRVFHFTLDVAASEEDRRCERWLEGPCVAEPCGLDADGCCDLTYDAWRNGERNHLGNLIRPCGGGCNPRNPGTMGCGCGLCADWMEHVCWLNPPYEDIGPWVKKCASAARGGATVVMLVYSGTGVGWYREAEEDAREVWLVDGRVQFEPAPGDPPFKHGNNRDSVIFVFRPPDGTYGPSSYRRFDYERTPKRKGKR